MKGLFYIISVFNNALYNYMGLSLEKRIGTLESLNIKHIESLFE